MTTNMTLFHYFRFPIVVLGSICCCLIFSHKCPAVAGENVVTISPIVIDGNITEEEYSILFSESNEIDVSELLAYAGAMTDIDIVRTLFFGDDVDYVTYVRKRAAIEAWYGEVNGTTTDGDDGEEENIGMINLNVIQGRLTGSAQVNDTVYKISTLPLSSLSNGSRQDDENGDNGMTTQVSRLAIALLPEEPVLCFEEQCANITLDEQNAPTTVGNESANEGDVDTIDAMIVYTYQAMCAEAKQEFPCPITSENMAPIEDLAALALEETNTAYELSGVVGRQRLMYVGMVNETYMEKASFEEMLNDLSYDNDGVLDDVHEWRRQYGADLVSMFVSNPAYCGMAWLYNGKADAGFTVVCADCATGYFSYAHETAHNIGAHHDEANAGNPTAVFSFGHLDDQERFRTIMSYDCPTKSCMRIQRFSSPLTTTSLGSSLGSETEDNARKLNFRWDEVAAFMEKSDLPPLGNTTTPTQTPVLPTTEAPIPTSSTSSASSTMNVTYYMLFAMIASMTTFVLDS